MNVLVSTKETPIFIPGPSGRVEALFHEQPQKNDRPPLIGVICHPHPLFGGTMQNKIITTIVKTWAVMGLSTLRFNFRGVGLSEGEFDKAVGEVLDLKAVLEWLLTKHKNAIFWLGGFSFGSLISAKIVCENHYPIKALLSVAPPISYFTFPIDEKFSSIPWIIMQGDKDELVKYETVVSFVNEHKKMKSNIEMVIFNETDHFFHGRLNELKEAILQKMEPLLI